MVERVITVTNTLGIHARPASLIVKVASQFTSKITIIKDDVDADAKSIMGVMMLAASQNSKIIIQALGDDEEQAADAIAELFIQNFNEE